MVRSPVKDVTLIGQAAARSLIAGDIVAFLLFLYGTRPSVGKFSVEINPALNDLLMVGFVVSFIYLGLRLRQREKYD